MADKKPATPSDDLDIAIAEPSNSGALATDTVTPDDDDTELSIRTATMTDRLRGGTDKLAGQVGEKARGFVAQGLERASEALTNVARMVGDTADGIGERVGPEYGEYARKAASALDDAGRSLANKNPDELIDDTREFVRKSPGMALAGAAVVGFVLARLVKSGLGADRDRED